MHHEYVPRNYSIEAIEAIFEGWKTYWSLLAVMATGTGKTEIYLQVIERFLRENPTKKALVIAHREELITQPAKRWKRNTLQYPAIEMGDQKAGTSEFEFFEEGRPDYRVIMASIQTLNSRKRCPLCTANCQSCDGEGKVDCSECNGEGKVEDYDYDTEETFCRKCEECEGKKTIRCKDCSGDGWICIAECEVCFEHFNCRFQKFQPENFGLIVIDEAHHSVAETYSRVLRYFRNSNPDIKLLGPTATPDRADEEALGKVYEGVAYTYSLPQPIIDGWLTPINQQFIIVEDLNLANVRTTAGDLNEGDLEREMMAEKVLHKVTTPLIEISCGMEEGTIDALIKENRLYELPRMQRKHEPTLIHAASVAHAERMTEIINRYIPDSARCIVGSTQKDKRRDWIEGFGRGDYQFLLSCGVFLEGTDLPNVSVIGMARPTKSRALYAQMLGRGLRPLSGLVDGVDPAEERCRLIAESAKPCCQVIDFVGNSGRHKLICAADILGDAFPDELVDGVIRKAVQEGQQVDILQALNHARERAEREAKEKSRREAEERLEEEERLRKLAANKRAGIVAGASYVKKTVNPFEVMELAPVREPGWFKGKMPTEKMKGFLDKSGVPYTAQTTHWEAHLLIGEIIKRREQGLCTYKQANWLRSHGYDPNMPFADCRKLMDAWAKNSWRRPE